MCAVLCWMMQPNSCGGAEVAVVRQLPFQISEVAMETGRYIDGSNLSKTAFAIAVIDFAVSRGFEIDHDAYSSDVLWLRDNCVEGDEGLAVAGSPRESSELRSKMLDILDAFDWTVDEALDYMNDAAPEGTYFCIHDSSLYLRAL